MSATLTARPFSPALRARIPHGALLALLLLTGLALHAAFPQTGLEPARAVLVGLLGVAPMGPIVAVWLYARNRRLSVTTATIESSDLVGRRRSILLGDVVRVLTDPSAPAQVQIVTRDARPLVLNVWAWGLDALDEIVDRLAVPIVPVERPKDCVIVFVEPAAIDAAQRV